MTPKQQYLLQFEADARNLHDFDAFAVFKKRLEGSSSHNDMAIALTILRLWTWILFFELAVKTMRVESVS